MTFRQPMQRFLSFLGEIGRIGLVACPLILPAATPFFESSPLWKHDTGGYAVYRIPGIVATRAGSVLAYAEARKAARSDWGESDILLRRSTDGGRTFSDP